MEYGAQVFEDSLAERQKELIELLCSRPELSMTEIQQRMGISRTWLYEIRDRLVKKNILHPSERPGMDPPFSYANTHPPQSTTLPRHAPVRHVWWTDPVGEWAVQATVLDRWDHRSWPEALPDEASVVVSLVAWDNGIPSSQDRRVWSWVAKRRERWTTPRTTRQFLPGQLTGPQLSRMTLAIAWALGTDAVVVPLVRSEIEAAIEDGPTDGS